MNSGHAWDPLRVLVKYSGKIAGAGILFMMAVTCVDIILRRLGSSIPGAYDLVRIAGGDYDDGYGRLELFPELLQELKAAHAGQVQIQKHKIREVARDEILQGNLRCLAGQGLEAGVLHIHGDQVGHLLNILNHKYLASHSNRIIPNSVFYNIFSVITGFDNTKLP